MVERRSLGVKRSLFGSATGAAIFVGVFQARKALAAEFQAASGGIDPRRCVVWRTLDQVAQALPVRQPVCMTLPIVGTIFGNAIAFFSGGDGRRYLPIDRLAEFHQTVPDHRSTNLKTGILAAPLDILLDRLLGHVGGWHG